MSINAVNAKMKKEKKKAPTSLDENQKEDFEDQGLTRPDFHLHISYFQLLPASLS
jgi:hypothetical protein